MNRTFSILVIFLALLPLGCGAGENETTADARHLAQQAASPQLALRALHARILERGPTLVDLDEISRDVAIACQQSPDSTVCEWGREHLTAHQWARIESVLAELDRQEREDQERAELCRAGDVEALSAMYPGFLDFRGRVLDVPAFEEHPVDAVVVIGISGNLVRKAKKVLARGMAREALNVQVRSPGASSGFSPNPFAQARVGTENLFYGHYTPEIEQRMQEERIDCDRYRNSAVVQGACRRDLTVDIVRDWLRSRGHRSVRFILSFQSSWPEFALLFDRELEGIEWQIDPDFDHELRDGSTFLGDICTQSMVSGLWIDYEFYVRTLFAGS